MPQSKVALGNRKNGQRAAMRMLVGNAVTLLICLCLQIAILCVRGPSCVAWPVYFWVLLILLCVAGIAIRKSIAGNWKRWLKIYAWSAQIGILTMVAVDYLAGGREFPWILYLLPVGVLSLGVSLGWRAIALYAFTNAMSLIVAGFAFGQIIKAVAGIALLIVVALPLIEIFDTRRDLAVLHEAIKVVINGKRENN